MLEEFQFEMGVDIATMKSNWERALPKLIQYFRNNNIPCKHEGTMGKSLQENACKNLSFLSMQLL